MGKLKTANIIVDLEFPIEGPDGTIKTLVMPRPKLKDLRRTDDVKGDVAKLAELVSSLAGVPTSFLDELDAADVVKIGEKFEPFFGKRQETGKTS